MPNPQTESIFRQLAMVISEIANFLHELSLGIPAARFAMWAAAVTWFATPDRPDPNLSRTATCMATARTHRLRKELAHRFLTSELSN